MLPFREFYQELSVLLSYFQSFALLLLRVTLAYGFYEPALLKWANFDETMTWFHALHIPFAFLSTLMAASVEIIGVVLLALGLLTRWVALPLMIVMVVAILTVHLPNGFSVANNGFEIPLYYFLFLAILATQGAGRFSLDHVIFGKER